jgi:hypothetical protein
VWKEESHVHEKLTVSALSNLAFEISRSSTTSSIRLFQFTTKLLSNRSIHFNIKRKISEKLCLPVIIRSSSKTVESVFLSPVKDTKESEGSNTLFKFLMKVVKEELPTDAGALMTSLANKVIAFQFLEALFIAASCEALRGSFTNSYEGGTFFKDLSKAAKNAATSRYTDRSPILWKYCSAAYGCLCQIVCKTQNDPARNRNMYDLVLFEADSFENTFLWENLVDSSINYNFEVETSFESKLWQDVK